VSEFPDRGLSKVTPISPKRGLLCPIKKEVFIIMKLIIVSKALLSGGFGRSILSSFQN
jgi:hypothetical protein